MELVETVVKCLKPSLDKLEDGERKILGGYRSADRQAVGPRCLPRGRASMTV